MTGPAAGDSADSGKVVRSTRLTHVLIYGLLPGLALILALAAGFLHWHDASIRDGDRVRRESVKAAQDCAVAMMSFRPDTIEKNPESTRACLTVGFQQTYARVVHDALSAYVKQNQVSAVAHISAAAPVSASENHATVLLFVDQALTAPNFQPMQANSSIRLTLDKIAGHWLIAGFDRV